MKHRAPNVLPEFEDIYENQGFVHCVCPDGHYFKNQEFAAGTVSCPTCGKETERMQYSTPMHEERNDRSYLLDEDLPYLEEEDEA